MKSKTGKFALGSIVAVMIGSACAPGPQSVSRQSNNNAAQASAAPPPRAPEKPHAADEHAAHGHAEMHGSPSASKRVPAHYANAASIGSLPPTLAPDGFVGRVREGYQAAQAIPKTLAQLPCYCYCDQGFGHKSLHSCFEDSHGAHCGVCVDEALFAYKLEKDQGFSPTEIREMVKKRFGPK